MYKSSLNDQIQKQNDHYETYHKFPASFAKAVQKSKKNMLSIDDQTCNCNNANNALFRGVPNLFFKQQKCLECDKQLFFLRPTQSLYFYFIKISIIYLFMIFLISGIFSIYQALKKVKQIQKTSDLTVNRLYAILSTFNLHEINQISLNNQLLFNILCFITVIVSIIFFEYFKTKLYKISAAIQQSAYSPSDYTIFVENIPQMKQDQNVNVNIYEKKLVQIFQGLKLSKPVFEERNQQPASFWRDICYRNVPSRVRSKVSVASVLLCYDFQQEYNQIEKKREKLMKDQVKQFQQKQNDPEFREFYEKDFYERMMELRKEQREIYSKYIYYQKKDLQQQALQQQKDEKIQIDRQSNSNDNSDEQQNPTTAPATGRVILSSHDLSRQVSKKFLGKAFITFQKAYIKKSLLQSIHNKTNNQVLEYLNDSFVQIKIQNQATLTKSYRRQPDNLRSSLYKKFDHQENLNLKISSAADPTNIIWTNLYFSDSKRWCQFFVTTFIVILMLATSCFVFLKIKLTEVYYRQLSRDDAVANQSENQQFNNILLVLAIVTFIMNFVIRYTIVWLTNFEGHPQIAHKVSSDIIKILLAQFLNTVIVMVIVQEVLHVNILGKNGLVTQAAAYLIISGSFLSVLLNAIDFGVIYRVIYIGFNYWRHFHFFQSICSMRIIMDQEIYTHQITLNKDLQQPEFDILAEYQKYLLQIYACLFFYYLIPITALISGIAFTFNFFIDVYKIWNYRSKSRQLGIFLSVVAFRLLQGSLVIFAAGNLYFSYMIYRSKLNSKNQHYQTGNVNIINIVSLAIAVCYMIHQTFINQPSRQILNHQMIVKNSEYRYYDLMRYCKRNNDRCVDGKKLYFKETYFSEFPATRINHEDFQNAQKQRFEQRAFEKKSNLRKERI